MDIVCAAPGFPFFLKTDLSGNEPQNRPGGSLPSLIRQADRNRLYVIAGAGRCRAGGTRAKRADRGHARDTAFFDMSTNSVAVVRKINAAFAEKNLYMLDSPVSGGPSGVASGKMAIWVGGDEQIFNRHKPVLDTMGG
jgi:hypothetical protein